MSTITDLREAKKAKLLAEPEKMLMKEPFKRGGERTKRRESGTIQGNDKVRIEKEPKTYQIISQDEYLDELNPAMHKVLVDENVPHICIKTSDGGFREIEHKKVALPYQVNIKDKKVLHLCGNPMDFTLMEQNPTELQTKNFITFKQYWDIRNQDGMKTKFVDAQKSMGDAGLLYYRDYKGRIKSRLLCYKDGYVLCPHNDANGDRLLESVYHLDESDREVIDSWDDQKHYRHVKRPENDSTAQVEGWYLELEEDHGFSEIPLVTHRGEVAWERAQSVIEVLEIMWNIFNVIQKRHGWGILYIKGKLKQLDKTVAGNVVLQDSDRDGKGSAEFKTPPNPAQMIEFLKELKYEVQTSGGATFILPQDIKMSGDVSAIAIQLSQSLDNEEALKGVAEWQNVASKMCRLFAEGLAAELVDEEINTKAITEFADLKINAKFAVWMPKNENDYNQLLATLRNSNLISQKTGIEKNTISKPDEESRIKAEEAEQAKKELEATIATAEANAAATAQANADTDDNNANNNE